MKLLYVIVTMGLFLSPSYTQEIEINEAEMKVNGACDMCKKRIETAVDIPEVKFAKWNKNTKRLKIAFQSTVSRDSLEKRIVAVGHDTESYSAADSVYVNLPKCCHYRDNTGTH